MPTLGLRKRERPEACRVLHFGFEGELMTMRDNRLRVVPRPRKKALATRARLATDEKSLLARQPHEHDESADSQVGGPHKVMRQAYVDLMTGQQDTDCRNRAGEILSKAAEKSRRRRK